jgi:translation initiation factor IF-2
MEKGLGVVVDCIIRWGKLEPGDYVLSGVHGGKVRILNDGKTSSYFHIDDERVGSPRIQFYHVRC